VTGVNENVAVEDARPPEFGGPAAGGGAAGPSYRAPDRKGTRAVWLGVAGLTAAVTIAAVGLPQIGWLAAQTTTTTWTARHAIAAVEVDVSGGDLTIRPSAESDVVSLQQTLTWTVNKPQVTEAWQGDTLVVSEDCAAPSYEVVNPCGASLVLLVPATVSVRSALDSGSMAIKNMAGAVNARARSGDITLDGDSGTLWARADSGGIHGDGLASRQVSAQTLSGDVDLEFSSAPTSVSASVESGDAYVKVPPGTTYRVSGQTASGDRHIEQGLANESAQRSIEIDSQSGDASLSYAGDN
jgi:hypothetical protein